MNQTRKKKCFKNTILRMNFNFGSQTSQPKAPSLSFGAAPAAAGNTGTNFGFGSTAPNAAGGALGNNTAPTAVVQPSLNFGSTTTTPASTATVAPLSFGNVASSAAPTAIVSGQPQATASGFSFGAAATAPAAAATATSKPTSLFSSSVSASTFGASSNVSATTIPAAGSTLQQQTTLNFGATSAIATPTTNVTSSGLGGTTVGLGGTLTTTLATNSTTDNSQTSSQNNKESNIPNELLVTVEEFKKFVKEERSVQSDIAHTSAKVHDKISEEINGLNQLVSTLSTGLARNCMLLDKIKLEAAQEIQNAEIAQRTRDIPPGLQYENLAPYEYFSRLISRFETQMLHYRRQIEETEQHLHSMTTGQQLSPEDISRALQKLHTAFIALAGQYQTIHETVLSQSESFTKWHRQRYGTSIEVYAGSHPKQDKTQHRSSIAIGPSPFGKENRDLLASAKAALIAQIPAQVPQNQISGQQLFSQQKPNTVTPFGQSPSLFQSTNTGFGQTNTAPTAGLLGSAVSPFGATSNLQTSTLQTGGKRGKH